MSDAAPHGQLVSWLKANVLTGIGLAITIVASAGTIVWTSSRWIATYEYQIELNKTGLGRVSADVDKHQAAIVSLDDRINMLGGRVTDLHNQSDAADAAMRARLDVIEALARYAADRAMQPNLPIPGPGARR